MTNSNVQIIIQARLSSTRLPRKILKMIDGKSIIEIVLNNCLETGYNVIVAVPFGEKSTILEHVNCEEELLSEGPELDVLSRFHKCATVSEDGIIVRVTSDCPLVAPELIRSCVDYFIETDATYLTTTNLGVGKYDAATQFPDGFDVEVFTYKSLCDANDSAKDDIEREHVTLWIKKNYECCVYNPGSVLLPVDNKYSIDTDEDYLRVNKIIESGEKTWKP